MARPELAGIHVLVTRPQQQAQVLSQLLLEHGATVTAFPVLEIVDVADPLALIAVVDQLESFDIAIFISANAVNKAMKMILGRRSMPAHLKLAAVGKSSAAALVHFGRPADIVPAQRFDSEALLDTPELQQVTGKRVVIFRGDGGRELLADSLVQRGAEVVYAECYRRIKPQTDPAELLDKWARGEIHLVVITSGDGLRNLVEMLGPQGQQWLRKTPLLVMSKRLEALAHELGVEGEILVPNEASDAAVLASILAWNRSRTGNYPP